MSNGDMARADMNLYTRPELWFRQNPLTATKPGTSWFQCLSVHPSSGVGIALNFVVLFEWFRANRPAFFKENLHFAQHQGVALKRGGVVRFLVPNVIPDRPGFTWVGDASVALVEFSQRSSQSVVDARSTRAPSTSHNDSKSAAFCTSTSI
ncbi:MAG: hypothetical protein ACRDPW_02220 [Mycobacteriales bacterium]